MSDFLSAAILLFLVIDPMGNLPIVAAMVGQIERTRRAKIVVRECVIAYGILILFMFFGQRFLDVMHLSEISVSIAGGVILFMIAIRMVFRSPEGVFGDTIDHEPFIVPLAIPLIAGPSALASVMLMVSRDPGKIGIWVGALTVVMLITTLVLACGERIERLIGKRAVEAIERLMGLILTAIAVEMLLGGIHRYIETFK